MYYEDTRAILLAIGAQPTGMTHPTAARLIIKFRGSIWMKLQQINGLIHAAERASAREV